MTELSTLRERLDAIDREVLELLKKRLEIVAEVKRAKAASGKHAFDRAREKELLERAEQIGDKLALPRDLVRAVMSAVLEASHGLQERKDDAAQADVTRRMLIVGGRGKMGRRLGAAFAARGHQIDVLEKGDALDAARIERADVVMVAVPMTDAEQITATLGPMVRKDALLCDINSLKRGVCGALAEHCAGEALGTHPMFGPTVGSLRRQKIVLCPVKPGPMSAWLEAEFAVMGAELIESDPDKHDKMMAVVQVLTHFGIMVMGRALASTGLPLSETLTYMSPIYRLEVSMIGRLFSQKPELYREILMRNPFGEDFRKLFVAQADALSSLIAQGDRDAFVASFRETGSYFRDFSEEAMALSDEIIDTIMSHP